jgi:predicted metal-binding protein
MSGCTRPSTVAFRAEGKTAYLFGEIAEADIPNLVTFLRLYSASPDGNLADARPLGSLREKAIARIPG